MALLAATIQAQTAPVAGSISGTVVDSKNRPVSAVEVRLIGFAPPSSNGVRPDRAGVFTFPKVMPGRYRLCLSDTAGVYGDPCVWTPLPPVVNLAPAQTQAGIRMLALRVTTVNIRVEDPGNLVDSRTPSGVSRTLALAACLPNGLVWPVRQAPGNGNGRDFRVSVAEGGGHWRLQPLISTLLRLITSLNQSQPLA